jgi:hypothetical protein
LEIIRSTFLRLSENLTNSIFVYIFFNNAIYSFILYLCIAVHRSYHPERTKFIQVQVSNILKKSEMLIFMNIF